MKSKSFFVNYSTRSSSILSSGTWTPCETELFIFDVDEIKDHKLIDEISGISSRPILQIYRTKMGISCTSVAEYIAKNIYSILSSYAERDKCEFKIDNIIEIQD